MSTSGAIPTLPDILVSFPGGRRVDAMMGTRVIPTDQARPHGGDDTAPEPFDLFLASLATCSGYYVLAFCRSREIPLDGVELIQHHQLDELTGRLIRVDIELRLPPSFPDRYYPAVIQAAEQCKVKRLLMSPPEVVVRAQPAPNAGDPRERRDAMAAKKVISTDEARRIGDAIGVDWKSVDLDQFRRGLEVELEHGAHDPQTNVTGDHPILTGKIAWAHLKEIRDYYTRLAKLEAEAGV